jgi:hypothetical protein
VTHFQEGTGFRRLVPFFLGWPVILFALYRGHGASQERDTWPDLLPSSCLVLRDRLFT